MSATAQRLPLILALLPFWLANTIQPSVGFYNLPNFANFDLPRAALNGLLTGAAGQINGSTRESHNVDRVGVGTGVYSLGAPGRSSSDYGLPSSYIRYPPRLLVESDCSDSGNGFC